MGFWEKNTIIIGSGSLLGGGFYFAFVAWQSLALGALAPPSLPVWIAYIVLQFCISIVGVRLATNRQEMADIKLLKGGLDERDQIVRSKGEVGQGHAASALIFVCMAVWFVHGDASILFHSIVAALVASELVRCGVQIHAYNRAV